LDIFCIIISFEQDGRQQRRQNRGRCGVRR
jgi:hypothetical protein